MILKLMLAAGVGGFVGSGLRLLCGRLLHGMAPESLFPWGTFVVNLAGCLIIGVLYGLVERHLMSSPTLSALLITGFCGGLTTFSSLSYETLQLIERGHLLSVALYVGLSLTLGLMLVALGRWWVRMGAPMG